MRGCSILLGASAWLASAALGVCADLPWQKPDTVFAQPRPIAQWTGFYGGLNAGGTWVQDSGMSVASIPLSSAPPWFQGTGFIVSASGQGSVGNSASFHGRRAAWL